MSKYWRQFVTAFTHPEHGWKTTHFWGPVANWALVGSAVYDATRKGPEVVSIPMTTTMCVYSGLFMRFAWCVGPRNYLLLTCHAFNECAQLTQLARGLQYQKEQHAKGEPAFVVGTKHYAGVAGGLAATGALVVMGPRIQNRLSHMAIPLAVKSLLSHPAGPFTIFFWAPTAKWLLSVSNILDYNRPVEKMSLSQQMALASTGIIWSRYSMVINPVNWNLFAVNLALAFTSVYHLLRIGTALYAAPEQQPKVSTA
eukprot:Hpha_TRINITY_DN16437_c4_g2::TRINITY_DN16437_c4_g2_i1::g.159695::m.159695